MKCALRIISGFLSLCFLAGLFAAVGTADTQNATVTCEKVAVPNTNAIVSDFTEFVSASGKDTSWMSAHGTGQTRVANVSSGTYFALFTGTNPEADPLEWSLFRVSPDGTSEKLYTDRLPYTPSGPTIHVMADKEEDIWVYSGWRVTIGDERFFYNLYHYDVETGLVTAYTTLPSYYLSFNSASGGGGYSMCCIDPERGEIYALSNGGDCPGSMEWIVFDIETKEWSVPKGVMLDYRYCYNFLQPDGKGGFHCIGMRDVRAEAVTTDVGLNVKEAGEKYHSRWTRNNMLFDEWDYFYIPDAKEAEILYQTPVEAAKYEVLMGMFPDCPMADVYTDTEGRLHFLYCIRNNLTPGYRTTHVVYDVTEGLKEVTRRDMDFLGGSNYLYYSLMTQDTEGAFYIIGCKGEIDGSHLEIWRADTPLDEPKLVWAELLPVMPGELQLASSRNGSIRGDTVHLGMYNNNTWFYFTVDLAALKSFTDR